LAGGFLAGTDLAFAAGFLATAFFGSGFFAAFLAVFAMFKSSQPLRNKTPGTDYSGEVRERKTETKQLIEIAKSVAKTGAFTNPEPRYCSSFYLNNSAKPLFFIMTQRQLDLKCPAWPSTGR
jgi:hypothetical protein